MTKRRNPPQKIKPAATSPMGILIVDDHELVRFGMTQLLSNEPGISVCGEAESVTSAIDQIGRVHPDLAVIDLRLHGEDGLELIRRLKNLTAPVKIIVYSMHEESMFGKAASQAGADGYVCKQDPVANLVSAIRCVLKGDRYFQQTAF